MATTNDTGKTSGVEIPKKAEPAARKTYTNWKAFRDGRFVPVRVRCEGYLGAHPADMSCHTNIHPSSENIISHMRPEHAGGWFKMRLRVSDSKPSPIWDDLEAANVEIGQLYCPHCRSEVQLTPRSILQHLQPHAGANRVNIDPQTLCFTLTFQRPEDEDMESLYMTEEVQ
jgi:hypothetical protein